MSKHRLREEYLQKRSLLTRDQVLAKSEAVNDNLFMDLSLHPFENLHIFLPIAEKNELNTWIIIERFRKFFRDKKIIVPRCDFKNDGIESVLLEHNAALKTNKWGIPEPAEGTVIPHKDIDVVFLPLVIFDMRGNRIGYGKGHYDKFLGACREDVVKVGLSLFPPVQNIDAEEHDVPMDVAITPEKVYFFR